MLKKAHCAAMTTTVEMHVPEHVRDHGLCDQSATVIMRLAHSRKAMHELVLGTTECQCDRVPISDSYWKAVGQCSFGRHWASAQLSLDEQLVRCAERGEFASVLFLLAVGADPSYQDCLPFSAVCGGGHVALVEYLLLDERVNPGADGQTPLYQACACGKVDVAKRLLCNARVDPGGDQEALYGACAAGHTRVVALLLQEGRVDPGAHNQEAICQASDHGRVDVVRMLLLHRRVDPSARRQWPLFWACINGHTAVLDVLLNDERVDPRARNKRVLMLAGRYGQVGCVQRLLLDPRVGGDKDAILRAIADVRHGPREAERAAARQVLRDHLKTMA